MTRTPGVATIVVACAALLYWGIGAANGSRKLAALEPLPPRAHYAITLAFPPERFHQMRLQDQGRVVEVRDRTVYIMDVSPSALHDVAREYWVDAIDRWAGR